MNLSTRLLVISLTLVSFGCASNEPERSNIGIVEKQADYQTPAPTGNGKPQNSTQMRQVQTDAVREVMMKRNSEQKSGVKASSKVADYNGTSKVKRVGDNPSKLAKERYEAYLLRQDQAVEAVQKMRIIVYCTQGRSLDSRSGGVGVNQMRSVSQKRPKSLVIVDGDPYDFKIAYKKSDYSKLKGSVKSVTPAAFDVILKEMQELGMARLETENVKVGSSKIGTERAIHIVTSGQRMSIFKARQIVTGTGDSPKAIFTKCEHGIIRLFAPSARGNVAPGS